MPINRIHIKNFKSLKDNTFDLTNLNCLIGENGSGKSNIIEAVEYFYKNLTKTEVRDSIFDEENPYSEFVEISLTYDISWFLKIQNQNGFQAFFQESHSNSFFRKINAMGTKYGENVRLTFRQNKIKNLSWNLDYEERSLLKSLFPIYIVKTRHINLTDWENLWEVIGDLNKLTFEHKEKDIDLKEIFEEIYGEDNSKIFDFIKKELRNIDIDIAPFKIKQLFTHIYQMQLGGNKFIHQEKDLDYYSDGKNSYNYILLLLSLVYKISQKKLKEPTVFLDEPEIGLHSKFIDYLTESIIEKSDSMNIIIATHSPRLLKNILRNNFDGNIYHLTLNKYTVTKKLKNIKYDDRSLYRITELEPSFYFSQGIVFVEGATEMQLFANSDLVRLFPELKKIDFYPISDETLASVVYPSERKIAVPYLSIIDMDKVLTFSFKNGKFKRANKKLVNPLRNEKIESQEKLLYGQKRKKYYERRKRIYSIIKTKFTFDPDWGFINEISHFNVLKYLVKKYCLNYNIVVLETTIEGMLVNEKNYDLVYSWLMLSFDQRKISILNRLYNHRNDPLYKTLVLRLVVDGKFDLLKTLNEFLSEITNLQIKDMFKNIKKIKLDKTSGWIQEFLEYFFDAKLRNKSIYEQRMEFKRYFPELSDVIYKIRSLLK